LSSAVRQPLHHDGGGVVAQLAVLVLEDRVVEAAHRLGGGQADGAVPGDEIGEAAEAEQGAVGCRPSVTPSV